MEDKKIDDILKEMRDQPMQYVRFSEPKDDLTLLKERWTGMIRHIGFEMIKREDKNNMTQPDLFAIANEIEAFFTALKSKP